jgi:membrane associated rhomboid family serine protease
MIPIRDTTRSQSFPVVNTLIIAANVVVFLIELSQGEKLGAFIDLYGLVPARYFVPEIAADFTTGQQVTSFLTFMFLHGGFLHLLGNMWSLFIFGDNVEDRLGHFRYLLFYLLCGLASGLAHLIINAYSQIPTVGASGAIAGVMGAYLILYPRARVLTLVPIFFFLYFTELPAFIFLGIWFLFQFLNAAASAGQVGGIAWWAHIGGFVFGILCLKLLLLLPETGAGTRVRRLTRKKRTPRLQVIRPVSEPEELDLHGVISVSERDARNGARKLVNFGRGSARRTFFVTVPPGVSDGSRLRLRGMGARAESGARGDLYLMVSIQN